MPRGPDGNQVSITKNGKTFVASTKPPSRLVADQVFEVIDELCEQTPDPVWLVQKELADFLGVATQTLSASINQLRADGRLEITRRGNDYGYRTIRAEAQMPLIAAITAGEHKPSTQAIADDTRAGRSRKQIKDGKSGDNKDPELDIRPEGSDTDASSDRTPGGSQAIETVIGGGEHVYRRRSLGESQAKSTRSDQVSEVRAPVNSINRPAEPPEDTTEAGSTWLRTLSEIRNSLPLEHYTTFVEPTVGLDLTADILVVAVISDHAMKWLEIPLHYSIACDALSTVHGSPLRIQYIVQPEKCRTPAQREPEVEKMPTPCPACGEGTMERTTWACMKSLPGDTYFCRSTGTCSRLWNSLVGEFHEPNQEQLDYSEAPKKLAAILRSRGMQVPRARARAGPVPG